MRSRSFPKSVLVAALGCLVLSACGTQRAASDHAAPAGSAVKATSSPKAPPSAEDQEVRFIGLVGRAIDACSPDPPSDKSGEGGEGVPVPGGLVRDSPGDRRRCPGSGRSVHGWNMKKRPSGSGWAASHPLSDG
ncbi:hypothetical protein [Streptomyces glaucescens]|uniref:hypothetical protein n=1 Tax=Streptomyces glaucescens TaxID=1907 RepID=UPI001181327D|nr:hypothetical protein [Streptomyces glaucescens]